MPLHTPGPTAAAGRCAPQAESEAEAESRATLHTGLSRATSAPTPGGPLRFPRLSYREPLAHASVSSARIVGAHPGAASPAGLPPETTLRWEDRPPGPRRVVGSGCVEGEVLEPAAAQLLQGI